MKKILLVATAIVLAASAYAQDNQQQRLTPEVMARLFPRGVVSPDYAGDGTVTFRFQAPNASSVGLECPELFSAPKPMEKDEQGVWSVSLSVPEPDVYLYCFVVDGTRIADPNNMFLAPGEGFKYSLADVRGEKPSVQDLQEVPHGKVSYRFYHSNALNAESGMCVYTPAGYNPQDKETYPVLYLLPGKGDTYESWFKVGRANIILDNLIAQGLAKKMIVVMPSGDDLPDAAGFAEKNYKVQKERGNRTTLSFADSPWTIRRDELEKAVKAL